MFRKEALGYETKGTMLLFLKPLGKRSTILKTKYTDIGFYDMTTNCP
ncbi:hypothetical protein SP39_12 [Salmonella phage 39]|nr:hypothetical protein SP39_12 [Salmonella phage 39]